jgi:hypothetical protein
LRRISAAFDRRSIGVRSAFDRRSIGVRSAFDRRSIGSAPQPTHRRG